MPDSAVATVFELLGPNGAGKTTVVRVLATLLAPDAGRAEVFGRDVVHDAAWVRELLGLTGIRVNSISPGVIESGATLAIWSAIAAGGGAVGLLLGGVLTDLASWRWIFFVNVPVGVALAVATVRFLPEFRSEPTHRTFDLPGAVSVTAGLVVLVFAIVKSQSYGWGAPRTIGLLVAGVVCAPVALTHTRAPQTNTPASDPTPAPHP